MVKRRLRYLSGAVLLLTIAALTVSGFWLLRTPQGARWLLESVVGLEVDRVEGRLAEELRLQGLRFKWSGGEARLDRLRLNWRPLRLLRGEIRVSELSLEGGGMTLWPVAQSKKAPGGFVWPRLSGWSLRLDGVIEALQLEKLVMHPPQGEAQRLERLLAHLEWHDGMLTVSRFDAAADGYRLRGKGAAGFGRPRLHLDMRLGIPAPVAEMDELRLTADLKAAGDTLFAGPVQLRGDAGGKALLQLTAEVALNGEFLHLRRIALTHASGGGPLLGEGEIALVAPFPFSLKIAAERVDLKRMTGLATEIGGTAEASGTFGAYEGRFDLVSRGAGWRRGTIAGRLAGSTEKIAISGLVGTWLGGTFGGMATIGWAEGIHLKGIIQGRGLDPAILDPRWFGEVNLDVEGRLATGEGKPLEAALKGDLLKSTLWGRPLTGRADLDLRGEDLQIAALELHGAGFDFAAAGNLKERMEVRADVTGFGGLLPGAGGSLQGRGWFGLRNGKPVGRFEVAGKELSLFGMTVTTLQGGLFRPGSDRPFTVRLGAGELAYERVRMDVLTITAEGTPEHHEVRLSANWPEGKGELRAEGRWRQGNWLGSIERLEGEGWKAGAWHLARPAALQLGPGRLSVEELRTEGEKGGSLGLTADLSGSPLRGTLSVAWGGIDLTPLSPWVPEVHLSGVGAGEANLRLGGDGSASLHGRIEASGRITRNELSASFRKIEATVDGDAGGLQGRLEGELDDGGILVAELASAEPLRPALPKQGELKATWERIDLGHLGPWLPPALRLGGKLDGVLQGTWKTGWNLDLTGIAAVSEGTASWQRDEGEVTFNLRTAKANWEWRGKSLAGGVDLDLTEVGRVEGTFRLPLPARVPTAPLPDGKLAGRFSGNMREKGLLSAVFPGLMRESEGKLDAELTIGGTWRSPDLGGRLHLAGAGAYLPAAGIELEEVAAKAELYGDRIRLVSFSARSGEGRIEGEGEVRLKHWEVANYRATLKGARFRAVNLPERQLLVSPDLSLSGSGKKLIVRGRVELPELIVIEGRRPEMVQESPDVVVVGGGAVTEKRERPLGIDLGVKVVLGERVLVKVAGVDARLSGELDLATKEGDEIAAKGEIRVAEGIYSAYGVQLKIVRGRLLYPGGPVGRPTLDILAQRTVGEVKAGVHVGGTPQSPVVKLVSDPAMPDTDVLSYIVLGHPLGGNGQQGLLMTAAGALLSRGESAVLQDRLKRRLRVDMLAVESGNNDVTGSMLTVGKYLSPRLFVSYGQSLFVGTGEARLRYEVGKHWDLESKMGVESGVDLFYKIEFR